MQAQESTPVWKYQRQFDYGDGVMTHESRPDLLQRHSPRLLNDEQVRSFLANGYLLLQPDLPESFHQSLYNRFVEIVGDDNDDNPGNNLLPVVPEMQLVFEDPVVSGALTSVLGDNYLMHPHRVLHDNPPGSDPQVWHHDSYWGYKRKVHNHHPWWVMIMYYPQDIYEQIGPTGVIPGSQCIAQRLENIEQLGIGASGRAGTCMMIHYDIWHRKMKNLTNLKRFMVKFEFIRMQRPNGVTWNCEDPEWRDPAQVPAHPMQPMWRAHWHWLSARPLTPSPAAEDSVRRETLLADLDAADSNARAEAVSRLGRHSDDALAVMDRLIALLGDDSEVVGLNAAYVLASLGKPAIAPLVAALRAHDGINVDDARCFIDEGQKSELEMVARNAAHALLAIGTDTTEPLLACTEDGEPRARKYACFALGELDTDAATVIDALVRCCRDEDPAVRLNAVEALGLKRGTDAAALALADALFDDDDEVRFNAALALARLGPAAAPAVPALKKALTDGNRYTVGYAVEALDRIGTQEALAALVPFLRISRWCPLTTKESLF